MSLANTLRDAARGVMTGERTDGDWIRKVPPFRRMMAHIMRGRNESVVYFDAYARTENLMRYIAEANERFHVDITHCLVAAGGIAITSNPKMNRFVVGRRLYQRKGVFMSFSMKRKKMGRDAKLAAVKTHIAPGMTFRELCDSINGDISEQRSEKKTYADKEFDLLDKLPRRALDAAVSLLGTLDHYNALPHDFIANDAMYTSMFIANLGSVGMGPGFHHLYEWGNCPLFMMVGQIETRALVEDGKVVVRDVIPIRYSYDERIDDGLNARFGIELLNQVLEDPYKHLGCLKEDGSDTRPLIPNPPK